MNKVIPFLEREFKNILKDKILLFVVISTLLEYVFFVLLLSDPNAETINFKLFNKRIPSLLAYISFALLPYSLSYLFPGIFQKIILVLVNIMISSLLIFDLWYFRSNSIFMNFYMFDMTNNLEGLSESILAMLKFVDLSFLLPSILLLVFIVFNFKKYKPIKINIKRFSILLLLPILYLTYSHIKIDVLKHGYKRNYLFKRVWSQTLMMHNMTPLGYHFIDYIYYRKNSKPYKLSEAEISAIKKMYSEKEQETDNHEYFGIFKGKNILILQIESLENFVINEKVLGKEITPNINKLLINSLYFSNYREQTRSGTSSDSTLIVNNSIYPPDQESHNYRYTYNKYNSLPRLLKEIGYSTYSMHPEKGAYWNWMEAERSMGFDNLIDITGFKIDEVIGMGISDKCFFSQIPAKIKKLKEPYYTNTLTLTSHSPFKMPREHVKISLPDYLKGTKTGAYIESINYADEAVGNLIDELNRKKLLENTVIIIYGDHEGISKYFKSDLKGIKQIPDRWKNNRKRIPLIIYSKNFKGKEFKVNCGQIDFLPTISSLMGISYKKYIKTALGRNVFSSKLDVVITSNKKFYGNTINDEIRKKYIKMFNISNIIIKSNYFEKYDKTWIIRK